MKIIFVFIFFLSIFIIGQNLDKPFWGEHDWNGVRYGNIARNYLRYNLLETKLGQIENSGFAKRQDFEYYTHYPPLLPLTIALSYKIFGVSEWSTRIIPLLATSGSIALIFFLGARIWSVRVGVLASLLALATPMVLYFGKNASHEPLAIFFILLSFLGYQTRKSGKYGKMAFILGLILAEMTAWAGYFLVPAITIVSLIRRDKKSAKEILPLWVLSLIIFLLHLGYVYFTTGVISGGGLFESLMLRSSVLQTAQPPDFSLLTYILKIRLWFASVYTIILLLLVLAWIVSKKFTKINEGDWGIFILGLVGVIYLIVFSNAVFIHNYLLFYFLPFLTLSAALGLDFLDQKIFKKVSPLFLILAIILVVLERRNFLVALNGSTGDKLAVDIGRAIYRKTSGQDTIYIPLQFSYSADKFLRFYSDRKLTYNENEKYNVKVLVDTDNHKFEIIRK